MSPTPPRIRHLLDESLRLDDDVEALAGATLGVVREVYHEIGAGLPEPIYQEALELAFADAGIAVQAQPEIRVRFRGRVLNRHARPDFLVGNSLVLELKSVEEWSMAHEVQLLTYLRLTGRPLGFLVNFRAPTLSQGVRRKILLP